jgi:hypothetical protein
MSRFALRWLAVALLAGGVTALAAEVPRLLRRLEYFRVRRVEVVGTRYMAPQAVLEASGITAESSIFDEADVWRDRLLRHPLVAAVRIERDLPWTVVLHVTEAEPVVFVRTPELRPVDGSGRLLPIDPAERSLDLPVLAVASQIGEDERISDPESRTLLAVLNAVRGSEPALAAVVSEVAPAPGGAVRLVLTEPAHAEVLLPADAGGVRLRQLGLTLEDLRARRDLGRVKRIDVRFHDRVVVSLSTPSSN